MSRLTIPQQEAVDATGNVLLEAGAGSGKTSTIVARCVDRILRGFEPLSVDRLLMVTFTEAAAAEMRKRLRTALETRLEKEPESNRLAEQIALLDAAAIGTLHSVCLRLIREEGHALGLDPKPSVIDPAESQVLAGEVFASLFEECCAGSDPHSGEIRLMARDQTSGERGLQELVLEIHAYLRSLPDPAAWLETQRKALELEKPEAWRSAFQQEMRQWSESVLEKISGFDPSAPCRPHLLQLAEKLVQDPDNSAATLRELAEYENKEKWEKGRAGEGRGLLGRILDDAEFLASQFPAPADSSDPLERDWLCVRSRVRALLQLVGDFDERFERLKRERGVVDFQDLEQHSLALLWDRRLNRPTRVAMEWRERFDQVVVDEYQDINAAQELILRAVSREEPSGNRFLVGDIKQSIYRFRLADPRIFRVCASEWSRPGAGGRTLPLAENFRSHERILQFVNAFFRSCMTGGLDGVDYPPSAELKVGAPADRVEHTAAPGAESRAHLWFTAWKSRNREEAADSPEEDGAAADRELAEARQVAARLRTFMDGSPQVWDAEHNGWRTAGWGDVAILLRSPRGSSWAFSLAFREAGIPISAGRASLFESIEFLDLFGLLELLDNPRQDIPLLGVLRSPLAGLTLDEIALIRAGTPAGLYWDALQTFPKRCPALAEKLAGSPECDLLMQAQRKVLGFSQNFERWRGMARRVSLSECLERILDESGYENAIADGPEGGRETVARLLDMTRRFDQLQGQGLFWFLNWVHTRREALSESDPAAPGVATGSVRLMSIHRSKGLEFPVVVVAGLGTQFNLSDARRSVILDENCGPCMKAWEPGSGRSYPTAAHWLAARRQKQASLGEELRLLYVAFTRARDWLFLSGTGDPEKMNKAWERKCTTASLIESNRPMDWVGMVLSTFPEAHQWWQKPEGRSPLCNWTLQSGKASGEASAEPVVRTTTDDPFTGPTEEQWMAWKRRMEWRYPHRAATTEPAKLSVSALRRRAAADVEQPAQWPIRTSSGSRSAASHARIGSATHALMEHLDLSSGRVLPEDARQVLSRLVRSGVIAQEDADGVDLEAVCGFWSGPLGSELLASAQFVRRELPFTKRWSADELAELGLPASLELSQEDGFLIVQGIVDLACITSEGIRIVDFKTDRVGDAEELHSRLSSYEPQLRLYASALEAIYQRPVTDAWLHFFSMNPSVSVHLPPARSEKQPKTAGESGA